MADEVVTPGGEAPLVTVTFQRNPNQKQKYLESEPKALGVTEIALSVFHICSLITLLTKDMGDLVIDLPQIIGSVIVVIAGILALAAQSLHLPTIKACLGMQVVACIASVFNLHFSVFKLANRQFSCWHHEFNNTSVDNICYSVMDSTTHFYAEWILIQTVLIAVSVTLAVYSSKVVNCCSPSQRMPMITVQVPPSQ
uniref:Uncharacterized protein n=1 Tax=Esox lucius TaxID=8010 RepID=A0A3P8ZKP6_ESOLU